MDEQTPTTLDPRSLVDTRLQLHHAAQLVAALGNSLLPPVPDYSHTALSWQNDGRQNPLLVSGTLLGQHRLRVGLDFATATLYVISQRDTQSDERLIHFADHHEINLNGKAFDHALTWERDAISKLGYDGAKLQPPSYKPGEFPDHAVADGKLFSINPEQAAELARYYTLANDLLQAVASDPQASPVRIWPHHFDIATLIALDEGSGEEARTIGAGMSPGDGGYDQPYFYVTPYPYPPTDNLPALPHGSWHTEGWVGAVLTASDLIAAGPDVRQTARDFLTATIEASRGLL